MNVSTSRRKYVYLACCLNLSATKLSKNTRQGSLKVVFLLDWQNKKKRLFLGYNIEHRCEDNNQIMCSQQPYDSQ